MANSPKRCFIFSPQKLHSLGRGAKQMGRKRRQPCSALQIYIFSSCHIWNGSNWLLCLSRRVVSGESKERRREFSKRAARLQSLALTILFPDWHRKQERTTKDKEKRNWAWSRSTRVIFQIRLAVISPDTPALYTCLSSPQSLLSARLHYAGEISFLFCEQPRPLLRGMFGSLN